MGSFLHGEWHTRCLQAQRHDQRSAAATGGGHESLRRGGIPVAAHTAQRYRARLQLVGQLQVTTVVHPWAGAWLVLCHLAALLLG